MIILEYRLMVDFTRVEAGEGEDGNGSWRMIILE